VDVLGKIFSLDWKFTGRYQDGAGRFQVLFSDYHDGDREHCFFGINEDFEVDRLAMMCLFSANPFTD
jgi:hypothetical protein